MPWNTVGHSVVPSPDIYRMASRISDRLALRFAPAVRSMYRCHQGSLRVYTQTGAAAAHLRREHGQHEGVRKLTVQKYHSGMGIIIFNNIRKIHCTPSMTCGFIYSAHRVFCINDQCM